MNKAFEKIIEKLEEREVQAYAKTDTDAAYTAYRNAIEIVEQTAIEYNNGWIPCSERLPEEYTVLCCDKYGEMIIGHPYFDEVSDTNYSSESDNEMMYNCVAWQPLPQPYQPKGKLEKEIE